MCDCIDYSKLLNNKRNQIKTYLNFNEISLEDFMKYINKSHTNTAKSIIKLCNKINELYLNDDETFDDISNYIKWIDFCDFNEDFNDFNKKEWGKFLMTVKRDSLFDTLYFNPCYDTCHIEVLELIYRYIIICICGKIKSLITIDFDFNADKFKNFITKQKIITDIIDAILDERPEEINLINLHCLDLIDGINYPTYDDDFNNLVNNHFVNEYILTLKTYTTANDIDIRKKGKSNEVKKPVKQHLIFNNELYILMKIIINYYQNKIYY